MSCGEGASRFNEGDEVAGFIGFPVRGGGYLTGAEGERKPINHGFKAVQIGISAWTAEARVSPPI